MTLILLVGCANTAQANTSNNTKLSYEPPAGFVEDSEIEGLYRSPDYPDDMSNIYVSTDTRTADFDEIDEDYFKENCLGVIAYTTDVSEENISYEVTDTYVAGYKAHKITTEFIIEADPTQFDSKPTTYKQIQYVVLVSESDVLWMFTLTQVGDSDWEKAFESSINGR